MPAPNSLLSEQIAVTVHDFDPDSANATDVPSTFLDMSGYTKVMAIFFRTVGTSALDTFAIIANTAADGSGTDVTLATHAVANEPDAVGDYIVLEADFNDFATATNTNPDTYRYIAVSAEFATATDEGVVVIIRSGARYAGTGLTAESVA